jgi:hypothetical protein
VHANAGKLVLTRDWKESSCHPERRFEQRLRGEDKPRDLGSWRHAIRDDADIYPGPSTIFLRALRKEKITRDGTCFFTLC